MAKKQETACMFCGGLPCVCDGGQKKKSSRSIVKANSPKTSSKASVDSAPSVKETEDVFGAIPTQAKPKFNIKPTLVTEVDLGSLSVLRMLRPLVTLRDQKRIDATVNRPYLQDLDRRMTEWKARHAK